MFWRLFLNIYITGSSSKNCKAPCPSPAFELQNRVGIFKISQLVSELRADKIKTDRHTHIHTYIQTDRQTDRQTLVLYYIDNES